MTEVPVPRCATGAVGACSRPRSPGAARRGEQRRLRRLDATAASLATLVEVRRLAATAAAVVEVGWVQGAWMEGDWVEGGWFAVHDGATLRPVPTRRVHPMAAGTAQGACLVGAVLTAGGGPGSAGQQAVQRTLDLAWHVLARGGGHPLVVCPAPAARRVQLRDLTRWNDARGRTAPEVAGLLRAVSASAAAWTAELQDERCRLLAGTGTLAGAGRDLPADCQPGSSSHPGRGTTVAP